MTRRRYALGITLANGSKWLVVRGASKCGPMRTSDPSFAQTWESPESVQEWLDSIPLEADSKSGKVPNPCRKWLDGVEIFAVPVVSKVEGELVPLDARESGVMGG